jgi:hypothetical protein
MRYGAPSVRTAGTPELIAEDDQVDGHQSLGERNHLVEDAPVGVEEQILAAQQLHRLVADCVIEQDSTQNRTLGLDVGWEASIEKRVTHCRSRHKRTRPLTAIVTRNRVRSAWLVGRASGYGGRKVEVGRTPPSVTRAEDDNRKRRCVEQHEKKEAIVGTPPGRGSL